MLLNGAKCTFGSAATGTPIPDADQPIVFMRLRRGDASRSTAGSGLGLSLVTEIMRLHYFAIVIGDNQPGCRVEMLCWPGSFPVPP